SPRRCAAMRCSPPDRRAECQRKSPPKGGLFCFTSRAEARPTAFLLDLRLFVDDVLADLRVKLLDLHLVRMEPLVLGRGVEVAGVGRRQQLDLFAHGYSPRPVRARRLRRAA